MLFDLHILGLGVGALDAEKVVDSALENGQGGEPKEENVPHANKSTRLDNLGTSEHAILVIVVLDHHDHICNHANRLHHVKPETDIADEIALVCLDHHMFFRAYLLFCLLVIIASTAIAFFVIKVTTILLCK